MQRRTRNPTTFPNQAFVDRRLAAILAADVVGFSRMIGTDEVGMLTSMRTLHNELVEPLIEGQGGRIFKLMGDGMLAEFPSAVWALHAAIEIQTSLKERNADFPSDGRLEMRVAVPGISCGVMVTVEPVFRRTGSWFSSLPVRIFGPCRSWRMHTVRPSRAAARRRR